MPMLNTFSPNHVSSLGPVQPKLPSNNFSVQQIMTPAATQQQSIGAAFQPRPSIIIPDRASHSNFTGGLNFSQIRQLNQVNPPNNTYSTQTSIPLTHYNGMSPAVNPYVQIQGIRQQNGVQLSNDLSLIEPTLPISQPVFTQATAANRGTPQQFQSQQQVNHKI